MELLPQSKEALDEYVTPSVDDVEGLLRVIEGWATRTVPECVALSVTMLDDDLTFTLVDTGTGSDLTSAPGWAAAGARSDDVDYTHGRGRLGGHGARTRLRRHRQHGLPARG